MYSLINQLSEGSLFPSQKSLEKYEPQEISEIAYLHILALYILLTDDYSKVWAENYCRRTTRAGNFRRWRTDATDTYVLMHALSDDKEKLHDEEHDAEYYRDGLLISPTLVFHWIQNGGQGKLKEDQTKSLFAKMDLMFRVRNASVRAVRRMVQDWTTLSKDEKRKAMTRLLNLMREHDGKSEVLSQLNRLAGAKSLESPADDSEKSMKKSFLTSLINKTSRIQSALRRESADNKRWQEEIDTADLLKEIKKIHYNPEDVDDGDLGERLWKYDHYVLQSVQISKIKNLNQFCLSDDPMVDEYATMPMETMPPIVLTAGYNIIDGSHRSNAAKKRGCAYILAYVGKPKVDINSFKKFKENASGGATCAASVATAVGSGFCTDYSKSVYGPQKKEKKRQPKIISRLTENAEPPQKNWNDLRTGEPATIYAWRGCGGMSTPLSDKWKAKLGREYLLGDGVYFAPSKTMASRFGDPILCKIVLRNPYVFHHCNGSNLVGFDLDAVRETHDAVVIMEGRGEGNEDIRQICVFPGHENQIEFNVTPKYTTVQPGAKVRIKPLKPDASDYARQRYEPLVGKTGKVTSMSLGHPNVKIDGKTHIIDNDMVELVESIQPSEQYLYHTTSNHAAHDILSSGELKPRNYDSFVSLSTQPLPHGDIQGTDVTLVFHTAALAPQLFEVEYDESWFHEHPEQGRYIAGEGWQEQFFYEPEDDEDEFDDGEAEELARSNAEMDAFTDKLGEDEWISKTMGAPIRFRKQDVVGLIINHPQAMLGQDDWPQELASLGYSHVRVSQRK